MFELIKSGGFLMWPLLLCSVAAMAIVCERLWALQTKKVLPSQLVPQVWRLYRERQLDQTRIRLLKTSSPLGLVLAAGLVNSRHGREIMKESIEETGRQVAHDLERFLNTLGTITSIAPLLGLLGTVFGMMDAFAAIVRGGIGDPTLLADGINKALITTAAGLAVAIPALMFHRYFEGRVDALVLKMEEEALKLIEIMHGEREEENP